MWPLLTKSLPRPALSKHRQHMWGTRIPFSAFYLSLKTGQSPTAAYHIITPCGHQYNEVPLFAAALSLFCLSLFYDFLSSTIFPTLPFSPFLSLSSMLFPDVPTLRRPTTHNIYATHTSDVTPRPQTTINPCPERKLTGSHPLPVLYDNSNCDPKVITTHWRSKNQAPTLLPSVPEHPLRT